ncbi:MAG: radical SAM protein [Desulfobacterales bacterium]|nr:radical SAM protein [Desulfobacterales bacterium]MCP4159564.1 radical SAM protein [Deltaproteobacteria bacterium]
MSQKTTTEPRLVHLLYVPTTFCNLGCRYCYLGDQIDASDQFNKDCEDALNTLKRTVEKLIDNNILPFNISLHGGEVTTLPEPVLESLFLYIKEYYDTHRQTLEKHGFKKSNPHIKTNLYNFGQLYDLFDRHEVSISGSMDLPFSLHEKYRTTRNGNSSLNRILENVKLLGQYPHRKKISATLFSEHLKRQEEIADNIIELHETYGFDMNRFNIMFGFESDLSKKRHGKSTDPSITLKMATDQEQVAFYRFLKERFAGTDLTKGFQTLWFEEFTPSFCTNSFNCGEKFYLLQSDGDVYSCVRGQGNDAFYYGNVYNDTIEDIIKTGEKRISLVHKSLGLHEDCKGCDYIKVCHTGCPFVKLQQSSGKSYTCLLQKEMYRESESIYPKPEDQREKDDNLFEYASDMHPAEVAELKENLDQSANLVLPGDFYDEKNVLHQIILDDPVLTALYSPDAFIITIDDDDITLSSQILKTYREMYHLYPEQEVTIHIKEDIFRKNCRETVRNTLYIQMLRDTRVIYGEEKRTKQEHLFTHKVYFNHLEQSKPGWLKFRLSPLLELHKNLYLSGVINNLFFTTGDLRDYHYSVQKNNGFYHVQAINLPFQNFEFYWDSLNIKGEKNVK